MNQSEFIEVLAKKTGSTRGTTKEFISNFISLIVNEAIKSGKCKVTGLGVFKLKDRQARTSTIGGREVDIPAHKAITFSPSKSLKESINS